MNNNNSVLNIFQNVYSSWTLYQLYFDAYSVFWMSVLFICILLDIRSGFIPLHWVLFLSLGNILRQSFFNRWRGNEMKYEIEIIIYRVPMQMSWFKFYRLEMAVSSYGHSKLALYTIVLSVHWGSLPIHSIDGSDWWKREF